MQVVLVGVIRTGILGFWLFWVFPRIFLGSQLRGTRRLEDNRHVLLPLTGYDPDLKTCSPPKNPVMNTLKKCRIPAKPPWSGAARLAGPSDPSEVSSLHRQSQSPSHQIGVLSAVSFGQLPSSRAPGLQATLLSAHSKPQNMTTPSEELRSLLRRACGGHSVWPWQYCTSIRPEAFEHPNRQPPKPANISRPITNLSVFKNRHTNAMIYREDPSQ